MTIEIKMINGVTVAFFDGVCIGVVDDDTTIGEIILRRYRTCKD